MATGEDRLGVGADLVGDFAGPGQDPVAAHDDKIDLAALHQVPGGIVRDHLVRDALAQSDVVRGHSPMLAQAAHVVASNQIREMGTLGGNLCQDTRCLYLNQKHDFQFVAPCYKREGACCYPFPQNKPDVCWSVYMSDVAPALIALGATLSILGRDGQRRMPLEDLYSGNGLKPFTLRNDEIIEAVLVPAAAAGSGWGYHKSARRGGLEFATSVAAVTLRLDKDGHCADIRIIIGAVRERPVRAEAAEKELRGRKADKDAIAAAAAAVQHVNPLPHHGFTKSYIVDNLRVHLRRVLAQAAERAGANGAA